jgi:transcriptional regulator with XRE-family HTH domain
MGALQKRFGSRIQQLRKAKGLTQEKLGQLTGMDGKVIGEIERGDRNPTLGTIERIIRGLEVEPYEPFLFSLGEVRPGKKVDKEVLKNLIEHSDEAIRPFIVELVQTALAWAQRKKK